MRKIERKSVPVPVILTESGGPAEKEKAKARLHFASAVANPAVTRTPYSGFRVYKDAAVKSALESLFHGKCAYCESRYAGIHPVDIEHWRPKAEIKFESGGTRYGYYWLAAEWSNLLPSCIDCNRERIHIDGQTNVVLTIGKGNWFPLPAGQQHARDETGIASETPLLINPCTDDPAAFFLFHPEGYVMPRPGLDNDQTERALVSIRVYALNRLELVKDRRERYLLLQRHLVAIRSILHLAKANPPGSAINCLLEDLLAFEIDAIERLRAPEQPFSTMVGQFVEEFRAELGGR